VLGDGFSGAASAVIGNAIQFAAAGALAGLASYKVAQAIGGTTGMIAGIVVGIGIAGAVKGFATGLQAYINGGSILNIPTEVWNGVTTAYVKAYNAIVGGLKGLYTAITDIYATIPPSQAASTLDWEWYDQGGLYPDNNMYTDVPTGYDANGKVTDVARIYQNGGRLDMTFDQYIDLQFEQYNGKEILYNGQKYVPATTLDGEIQAYANPETGDRLILYEDGTYHNVTSGGDIIKSGNITSLSSSITDKVQFKTFIDSNNQVYRQWTNDVGTTYQQHGDIISWKTATGADGTSTSGWYSQTTSASSVYFSDGSKIDVDSTGNSVYTDSKGVITIMNGSTGEIGQTVDNGKSWTNLNTGQVVNANGKLATWTPNGSDRVYVPDGMGGLKDILTNEPYVEDPKYGPWRSDDPSNPNIFPGNGTVTDLTIIHDPVTIPTSATPIVGPVVNAANGIGQIQVTPDGSKWICTDNSPSGISWLNTTKKVIYELSAVGGSILKDLTGGILSSTINMQSIVTQLITGALPLPTPTSGTSVIQSNSDIKVVEGTVTFSKKIMDELNIILNGTANGDGVSTLTPQN